MAKPVTGLKAERDTTGLASTRTTESLGLADQVGRTGMCTTDVRKDPQGYDVTG